MRTTLTVFREIGNTVNCACVCMHAYLVVLLDVVMSMHTYSVMLNVMSMHTYSVMLLNVVMAPVSLLKNTCLCLLPCKSSSWKKKVSFDCEEDPVK